jgi:hypothetical protein
MPTPQRYARIVGVAYLVIIIVSMIYAGLVESQLAVAGDDVATATNISNDEGLFRVGLVLVLVIYTSVLVASWALYGLLRTFSPSLALLALILRSAEAVLGAATVFLGFAVLHFATGEAPGADVRYALVGRLVEVRTAALDVVLVFVGLGAGLFCCLLLRSRYIPRFLSVWGILTYLSMLCLALVSIVYPAHPEALETVLYGAGTAFELLFGFWLVVRGPAVDGAIGMNRSGRCR